MAIWLGGAMKAHRTEISRDRRQRPGLALRLASELAALWTPGSDGLFLLSS